MANGMQWEDLVANEPHLSSLPPTLASTLVRELQGARGISKGLMRREASSRQFGGGGGCTDPFSVFTFLAFALAVMDLLMEMSRKRKRRDTDSVGCMAQTPEEELEEMVLATYSIVRATLNSEEVNQECVARFMCEGGREVARGGDGARLLVELGGSLLGEARRKGLERGLTGEQCDSFSCSPPSHYRTPRVATANRPGPDHLVFTIRDVFKEKFAHKFGRAII